MLKIKISEQEGTKEIMLSNAHFTDKKMWPRRKWLVPFALSALTCDGCLDLSPTFQFWVYLFPLSLAARSARAAKDLNKRNILFYLILTSFLISTLYISRSDTLHITLLLFRFRNLNKIWTGFKFQRQLTCFDQQTKICSHYYNYTILI